MPISGLVVTLADPADGVPATIGDHASVTCGQLTGNRLPVVIDADSDRASRDAHAWVESQAEVVMVDVVYVAFDDQQDQERA